MSKCYPFQDLSGNIGYIPTSNGSFIGSNGNGGTCIVKPTTTSYFSGVSIREINIPDTSAPARKEFLGSLTQLQPYAGPEFVPYTQPSQSFIPEPKYIPPTVNTPPSYTTGDNYVVQELTTNLSKWQNLNYIDFSGKQLGSDSCRQFNEAFRDAKLPNLLTLVLTNNQISDSGIQYLIQSLIHHYNNNLTTLNLSNNNLTNNGVTPFADGFNQINTTTFPNGAVSRGQITKLKTLDLRGNDKVCFTGKLYFFKDITNCKTKDTSILFDEFTVKTGNSHSLNLSSTLLSDNHYGFFSASFSSGYLSSLHTLVLSNNKMGDAGSVYLAKSLINHYCNNLTTLNLANNNLTNNGVIPFADGFSNGKITKLKYLDLRGNSKICFSGKLYFFKDIPKYKTKDTSILFDEFTIKTGDIHFLTSNNKLLNDSHISWITGAFHYQWLTSIHNLNLSNNQIGNDGAKLLANSLSKGEMPNLKKLHLEGNNITDKGETALVKAMKGKAQDIIILTQRVDITKKMISGTKEEKIAIYKDLIEKGKAKGTYDEALVIDKSLWGEIKNSGKILKVVTNASIGFTKCHFAPEDIAVDYAQNKIMAKLPKMINGVLNYAAKLVDLENIFTCYVDASEDAWTSAVGQQAVKHELCVVGETEFCGE